MQLRRGNDTLFVTHVVRTCLTVPARCGYGFAAGGVIFMAFDFGLLFALDFLAVQNSPCAAADATRASWVMEKACFHRRLNSQHCKEGINININ
jgi:hypothetical protein